MSGNLAERFAELPDLLSAHVILSLAAILTGIAISVPLGILVAQRARTASIALSLASVIQTIPGLALLALMVPLLGGTIGFWPAFVALMLYSVLPILRNTIVGLQGIDPQVREAARGVGLTDRQRLWQIELPLALPVIVAGLRTATVWVVGAATLATPVGAPSLGNYIFAGLQTRNWVSVLFGCLFAAGLAILLDQMIRMLETAARDRRRGLAAVVGVALAVLALASIAPRFVDLGGAGAGPSAADTADADLAGAHIVVGAKAFTEQYILAELIERRLTAAGARVERRDNLGSTIAFDALASGEIDVYVDYTGTIWATVMDRPRPVERQRMLAEMTGLALPRARRAGPGPAGLRERLRFCHDARGGCRAGRPVARRPHPPCRKPVGGWGPGSLHPLRMARHPRYLRIVGDRDPGDGFDLHVLGGT